MTSQELTEKVGVIVDSERQGVIGNHNLHSLYLAHHDPHMADFDRQADLLFIDGMGIVLLGRWLGAPVARQHRVTYVDWIEVLCAEAAARGWRLLHLGGRPGVGERAARRLAERHPGLSLATISGYFDARTGSVENRAILDQIRAAQPHVLLVGMGMPRQERWITENLDQIDANVILTCGSCMDYIAGETRTAPRWAGPLGLEWLFRLAVEPRRLARRYLVEPWYIARLGLRERTLGNRKHR